MIPELPPEQRVERAPSQPITSAVGEPSALAVLRNRPFLLLWLSQAATQIGGNMVIFGLTFIIFSSTNSSAAVSGLLLTFLVPSVLFSAVAGVYVDRLDRRRILVVTNLIRAAAFGAMLLVGDHLLLLYLLNTLVAIASTLFAPAEAAMIPRLVPRSQLLAANGIFTLTLNAAFPIGFALLGGIVVNLAGAPALLMLVALLYLVAAGFCYTLPPAPPAEEGDREHPTVLGAVHDAEQAVGSTFGQLSEGIDFIRQNRSVSWSLVYLGVTASLIGVLGSLGPGFASKTLGLNPKDIVVVVLPMGFGIVMGLLLLNSYGRLLPRRRLIEGGLISLGVLIVLLSLAGPITRFLQRVQTASRLVDPYRGHLVADAAPGGPACGRPGARIRGPVHPHLGCQLRADHRRRTDRRHRGHDPGHPAGGHPHDPGRRCVCCESPGHVDRRDAAAHCATRAIRSHDPRDRGR